MPLTWLGDAILTSAEQLQPAGAVIVPGIAPLGQAKPVTRIVFLDDLADSPVEAPAEVWMNAVSGPYSPGEPLEISGVVYGGAEGVKSLFVSADDSPALELAVNVPAREIKGWHTMWTPFVPGFHVLRASASGRPDSDLLFAPKRRHDRCVIQMLA